MFSFVSFRGRMGSGFSTILFFLIVAAVLVLSGCGGGGGGTSVQPPPSSESFTVSVQDAFTRSPLSGASVQIGSKTLTTNSSGIASFLDLNPGVYTLTVSKSGYQSFSLKVPCNKGMQFQVRLTPNLTSPVTDQTFHQASLNVLGAARGLQEAFDLMNSSPDPTKQDPFVFFISASKAFSSAVDNLKTYTPSKGTRSVLDILSTLGSLLKIEQGREQIEQTRDKLYAGQDVPEIDAWLANHPYEGAHSLKELRSMYENDPVTLEYKYNNLMLVYQTQSPNSGLNTAMGGAEDIWTSQFTQVGEIFTNLIGWTVDKVWSGTKDIVIKTINYGDLVLEHTDQIAWLWEKGKQKLLIGEVKKDTPMTLPQGTMDTVVSNGYAHKPTIQDSIPITGAGTQTIDITAEPINVTPPATTQTYVGSYSGDVIVDNNLGTWKHSLNVNITLTISKDADGYITGTETFNGTWTVTLISLKPGITLDPPTSGSYAIQNASAKITGYNNEFGSDGTAGATIDSWTGYAIWLTDGVINSNSANATLVFNGVFRYSTGIIQAPVSLTLQKARKR